MYGGPKVQFLLLSAPISSLANPNLVARQKIWVPRQKKWMQRQTIVLWGHRTDDHVLCVSNFELLIQPNVSDLPLLFSKQRCVDNFFLLPSQLLYHSPSRVLMTSSTRCKVVCSSGSHQAEMGPLMVVGVGVGGGSPILHVYSKKWQCLLSLALIFPYVTCQIYVKVISHVTIIFIPLLYVAQPYVAC